jgi:hypothetical protein
VLTLTCVSRPFPSWNRSILTEIYLCPRLFLPRIIEDGNGRAGDNNCDQIESWINPQAMPPPAPPLARPAPNGELWATHSAVGGGLYRHVLVPLLRRSYELTLSELQANDAMPVAPRTVVVDNAHDTKPATAKLLGSASAALHLSPCGELRP